MEPSRNHGPREKEPFRPLALLFVAAGAAVIFVAAALVDQGTAEGRLLAVVLVAGFEFALLLAGLRLRRSHVQSRTVPVLLIVIGLLVILAVLANSNTDLDLLGGVLVGLSAAVAIGFAIRVFVKRSGSIDLVPVFVMLVIAATVALLAAAANAGSRIDEMTLAGVIGFAFALGLEIVLYLLYLLCTAWLRRSTTERIIISQIATVVRQNLPLATGLALAAEAERGWARMHLRRIAQLLAQGQPLSQAVRHGYPDCSALPLSLIAAGERAGQLAAAVEQAEAHLFERERRRPHDDMSIATYVIIVSGFAALIVSGIMVAIVPKFKEIFKDFDTRLPGATVSLVNFSEFVVNNPPVYLAPLVIIPLFIYWSVRPRQTPVPSWSSRTADWIRWHTPGWRRVERARSLRTALQVIRMGTHAGMGLPAAVQLTQAVDMNTQLRPQVARWGRLLDSGMPIREATREAGLDDVTGVALAGGQRSGDMDAALRYAVDYHGSIASRCWIVLRNMTWPVWTLLMGSLVGWIVVALFQPLVALIDSVSR